MSTEQEIQSQKTSHKETVQKYFSNLSEEKKTSVKIKASQTKVTNELLLTEEDIQLRKTEHKEAVQKYKSNLSDEKNLYLRLNRLKRQMNYC